MTRSLRNVVCSHRLKKLRGNHMYGTRSTDFPKFGILTLTQRCVHTFGQSYHWRERVGIRYDTTLYTDAERQYISYKQTFVQCAPHLSI